MIDMDSVIFDKLTILKKRFYALEKLLIDPNIIRDQRVFRSCSKEYAQLSEIITCFKIWLDIKQKIIHTQDMLSDPDMYDVVQEELKILHSKKNKIEHDLKILLLSKNSYDDNGCFIELRAGTGGKEASIFTGDLFKMYMRYAETQKWIVEIIHINRVENGGYKEVIIKISCKGAYGQLKFESGGHRVQRIPNTESQGRVHTSTCTVAVIPEMPEVILPDINPTDLRIDTFRSSGAGGQHVNTTDSAIRVTHIPSGLSVECQDERSQHKNKAKALSVLASRLHAIELKRRHKEVSDTKRNLLGTGDRSDRIRTYNFQQGRVTDHRISFTSYKLNDIMDGNLNLLIKPIVYKHQSDQLDKFYKSKE